MPEFDLTLQILDRLCVGRIHDLGNDVQDRKNLLCGGEGALQHVKLLCQGLDRVVELVDVHVERDDNAGGDRLSEPVQIPDVGGGAEVEQEQDRGDVEHVDHRAEDAEDQHSALPCLSQLGGLPLEVPHLAVLAVEALDDLDAGQILGEIGVQRGRGVHHAAVDLAGELAENHREENDEGRETEDHQRQRVVQNKHRSHHADDDHRVFQQRDQHVGKQEGDRVRIVGDAGDQLAHRDLVELLVRQGLNVGEDVHADLRQDLLPDLLQQHRLGVGADQGDDQDPRVHRDHRPEPGQGEIGLDHLLDPADQQGREHVVDDGEEHHEKDQHELTEIGPGVAEQTADDLTVLHVPLKPHRLFLVLLQDKGEGEAQGEQADDRADDQKG